MKNLLTTLLVLISISTFSQSVDTVIDKGIYKSYFSKLTKTPLYVTYKLYQSGAIILWDDEFKFKNDIPSLKTAESIDYKGSGYEKVQLADAEDFSSDSSKEEITFRFYNCVPQTPNLNRNHWKKLEGWIREYQFDNTDSVFVICGVISSSKSKKMGKDSVYIPDYCWKVVKSLSTGEVIRCMLFDNITYAHGEEITIEELKSRIPYKIDLHSLLN